MIEEQKPKSLAVEIIQDLKKERKRLIVSNILCGIALIFVLIKKKGGKRND